LPLVPDTTLRTITLPGTLAVYFVIVLPAEVITRTTTPFVPVVVNQSMLLVPAVFEV
jgi:hypothetical protein